MDLYLRVLYVCASGVISVESTRLLGRQWRASGTPLSRFLNLLLLLLNKPLEQTMLCGSVNLPSCSCRGLFTLLLLCLQRWLGLKGTSRRLGLSLGIIKAREEGDLLPLSPNLRWCFSWVHRFKPHSSSSRSDSSFECVSCSSIVVSLGMWHQQTVLVYWFRSWWDQEWEFVSRFMPMILRGFFCTRFLLSGSLPINSVWHDPVKKTSKLVVSVASRGRARRQSKWFLHEFRRVAGIWVRTSCAHDQLCKLQRKERAPAQFAEALPAQEAK
jgi:hypothetical protein